MLITQVLTTMVEWHIKQISISLVTKQCQIKKSHHKIKEMSRVRKVSIDSTVMILVKIWWTQEVKCALDGAIQDATKTILVTKILQALTVFKNSIPRIQSQFGVTSKWVNTYRKATLMQESITAKHPNHSKMLNHMEASIVISWLECMIAMLPMPTIVFQVLSDQKKII